MYFDFVGKRVDLYKTAVSVIYFEWASFDYLPAAWMHVSGDLPEKGLIPRWRYEFPISRTSDTQTMVVHTELLISGLQRKIVKSIWLEYRKYSVALPEYPGLLTSVPMRELSRTPSDDAGGGKVIAVYPVSRKSASHGQCRLHFISVDARRSSNNLSVKLETGNVPGSWTAKYLKLACNPFITTVVHSLGRMSALVSLSTAAGNISAALAGTWRRPNQIHRRARSARSRYSIFRDTARVVIKFSNLLREYLLH